MVIPLGNASIFLEVALQSRSNTVVLPALPPSFSNALSFASGDYYGGSTTLSASFSNHKSSVLELPGLQNLMVNTWQLGST